jgi:murein DD-endopeptidase MepM/ murein hydrolase activator NlpD
MKKTGCRNGIFGAFAALLFLPLCSAAGCGTPPGVQTEQEDQAVGQEAGQEAEPAVFRSTVIPASPAPGEPVTVAVTPGFGVEKASLMAGSRRLGRATFFRVDPPDGKKPFMATVITVPSTVSADRLTIALETADGTAGEIPLELSPREFRSETIRSTPAMAGIQADDSREKTQQAEQLWAILNRVGDTAYYLGSFQNPLDYIYRTSAFGSRRVFVNPDGKTSTSIHAGGDYRAALGTWVFACGGGKVVMARPRIVSGNSVMIEHLPGVYSIYYHLDSIRVAEGDFVRTGDILGLSGTTGYSTGPHLHWEVRVFGENTDPEAFVSRPLVDTDAVLSVLYP